MNRKHLLVLAGLFWLTAGGPAVRAQDLPPAPPTAPSAPAPAPEAAMPAPPAPFAMSLFSDGDNFLGVQAEALTNENAGRYGGGGRGVGVSRVVKDSPAERAGVREGDVILRFDGEEVTSVRKLNRLIDEAEPGHTARLSVRRGGGEQELSVKLARRRDFARSFGGVQVWPDSEAWQRQGEEWKRQGEAFRRQGEEMRRQLEQMRRDNPNVFALGFGGGRRIGVATSPLGKQLADFFGVAQGGVLVSSVEENSPADKVGLKAGDVITEAEGERVEQQGDLSRALNRKQDGDVTLTVVRDKKRRTVKVTPERRPSSFNLNPQIYFEPPDAAAIVAPRVRVNLPRLATPPRAPRPPRVVVVSPAPIL